MGFLRRVLAVLTSKHDTPTSTARRLLQQNLTAAQLAQYSNCGYFDVHGGETGHCYRIHDCEPQNVDERDSSGAWVGTWCFSPAGNLARGDILLGQKMALELYESEARNIGTRYPLQARTRPLPRP